MLTTIAVAFLATSALAISTSNNHHTSNSVPVSSLTIPLTAGLPPPPSNLTLVQIVLGVGIQNYTCVVPNTTTSSTFSSSSATSTSSGASPTLTPKSIGALATLHHLNHILTQNTTAFTSAITSLPCTADALDSGLGFPIVGHHFFSLAGVPIFNLSGIPYHSSSSHNTTGGGGLLLTAKKIADVRAPSPYCSGRNGAGAVDWLFLEDNGSGESRGLKAVYRVKIAGGMPVAGVCGGKGVGEVVTSDYSAIYWFLR